MKGVIRTTLAAGFALVGAASLAACGESKAEQTTSAVPEAAVAERRNLDIRAEAAGQIQPIRVVEVKSKASGEILRMLVETGDKVERGALLADIDPRDVRNALAQAEADLDVAQARYTTAQAQRKRSTELRQANVITEQEFESAQLEEANAKTSLVKAQTSLELARERMSDVTIRAPIAGTVIQKSVEVGQIIASASQTVSGGTTLLLMADLSDMQVRTLIDETDVGKISAGQSARVTVSAFPDRTFTGEVLKIEPQAVVEQNVTMFPVLIQIDNRAGLLKPGMNAEVAVEIARREDVVVIPNAAVVSMRDAAAAGAVLGLSEEAIRNALRGGRGGPEGQAPDAAAAASRPDSAHGAQAGTAAQSAAAPAAPAGAGATDCAALREKMRGGDWSALSEADRAKMRECMPQGGRQGRMGEGGRQGGRNSEVRPGVVFVRGATGPEVRRVMLGVNDWDNTEVVQGLEAGDSVILISVARLQQQQQQMMDRMRQMQGGPFPGAQQGGRR